MSAEVSQCRYANVSTCLVILNILHPSGPFVAYFFKMMKIKIFVDIVRSKGALLSIKEDLKNRG